MNTDESFCSSSIVIISFIEGTFVFGKTELLLVKKT